MDSNDPKQLFIGVDSSKFYRLCANSFERIWEDFTFLCATFVLQRVIHFIQTLDQQIYYDSYTKMRALLLFIQ